MHPKKLAKVTIEFRDGSVEEHIIDPSDTEGFFRERYTYQEEAETHKILHKLKVSELFWAKRIDI